MRKRYCCLLWALKCPLAWWGSYEGLIFHILQHLTRMLKRNCHDTHAWAWWLALCYGLLRLNSATFCKLHCFALQRQWALKDGKISFRPMDERMTAELPSKELIDNALTYAREIERIV